MKKILMILGIVLTLVHCGKAEESPLILPIGSEPSAKIHNDLGIFHYKHGRYLDAFLQFNQAKVADNTTGEIHFNLGLASHMRGESEKAREHFMNARNTSNGNKQILESKILNQYLNPE